ncbi:MAG TPA: transcriptional regulator [Candidatus Thermoplasmatota archaeon]|nr:transcriptional regulator [Candidatus Thermoplasmatota archaeon]
MRSIQRELALAGGTLSYHLDRMVKLGLLSVRDDGHFTRYYVAHQLGRREKDVMAVLRHAVPRRVVAHLLLHPDASHGEILPHAGVGASTLSFHLRRLLEAGVVAQRRDGRENRYLVVEPDLVASVLVRYKASFVDDVVDRFAEAWLELAPPEGGEEEPPPGERG